VSIEIFHDSISPNAHKQFETWRHMHLTTGFFLNPKARGEVMLHRADCPHLDFGRKVSLTSQSKVCSTSTSELRTWAFRNKLRVKSCNDCDT
jgi:hypothetical protein